MLDAICKECGRAFKKKTKISKFCSTECTTKYWRNVVKAKADEKREIAQSKRKLISYKCEGDCDKYIVLDFLTPSQRSVIRNQYIKYVKDIQFPTTIVKKTRKDGNTHGYKITSVSVNMLVTLLNKLYLNYYKSGSMTHRSGAKSMLKVTELVADKANATIKQKE